MCFKYFLVIHSFGRQAVFKICLDFYHLILRPRKFSNTWNSGILGNTRITSIKRRGRLLNFSIFRGGGVYSKRAFNRGRL